MSHHRTRHDDAPTYDPHTDRAPSWKELDKVAQRIIAIAAAVGILITVVAWIGKTLSTETRLAALELQMRQVTGTVNDTKSAVCFLARKSGQPIIPPSCNSVTP